MTSKDNKDMPKNNPNKLNNSKNAKDIKAANNSAPRKAVALKYNHKADNAPRITASGQGEIAKKIEETARQQQIPIQENQDIVDILVKMKIGEEIPTELYQAVAEIFSFIYQIEEL